MKLKIAAILLLTLCIALQASAKTRVVATYQYIGDLVKQVGGSSVQVTSLARGDFNPHVIIARPSYIAKVRRADLLIINGAQLEIGWLPPILKKANRPEVNPGSQGFLDLSNSVKLIDVQKSVSRAQGDVHPDGNPHYYLDPYNIPPLAEAIKEKLCEIDSSNCSTFTANLKTFKKKWDKKCKEWKAKMAPMEGKKIVEYHKNFDYFMGRFGLVLAGTVEPLPGIPPSVKHIEATSTLIRNKGVVMIFHDVYNPDDASRRLASNFGIHMVKLPHDVGALEGIDDIFDLFDEMVRRICTR